MVIWVEKKGMEWNITIRKEDGTSEALTVQDLDQYFENLKKLGWQIFKENENRFIGISQTQHNMANYLVAVIAGVLIILSILCLIAGIFTLTQHFGGYNAL